MMGGHPTARTFALMAVLIAVLGIGGWTFGGGGGLLVFASIGVALNFFAYWFSDRLALMAHRARPLPRAEAPELYEMVERLAGEAKIPTPPIYLIPSESPNAFATGRGPSHSAVAVTHGLLELLDARQLEAVLAHELSHVRNRDVLVGTIAAAIAGVVSSLGYALRWGMLLGGGGRGRRDSSFAALAWIIVAPIIALLVRLAISRTREYAADASGARLLHDPDALADALSAIDAGAARRPYEFAGPATAHLFIVNPLKGAGARAAAMLSTHPPIEARIARLHEMAATTGRGSDRRKSA